MSSANNDQTENDLIAPVLFQCAACRRILGDTLSFVASDETTSSITLSSNKY